MVKVEFTIEPFVDGDPPVRVTATVEALEQLGITVEIGPFGSSFTVSEDLIGEAMATLVSVAYANGATHVALDTEAV
ncbi:MAG: hypothetical protein ACKOCC_01955 [Actinomycetota bacterium]